MCVCVQVVQLDCPDDTESYIHRVGRTARFRWGVSCVYVCVRVYCVCVCVCECI